MYNCWGQRVFFSGGSVVKNPPTMQETWDMGLIPGLGRCPGEGNGDSLQYSCLENPIDRGAWQATVYRSAKSDTYWSDLAQEKYAFRSHPEATYTCEASVALAIILLWRLHEWTQVAASWTIKIFKKKREVSIFSNQKEFKDQKSDFSGVVIL